MFNFELLQIYCACNIQRLVKRILVVLAQSVGYAFIISLSSSMFAEPACIEGSRLSDQFTFNEPDEFGGRVEVTGGILEACVNGSFLQMCNGSSTDIDLANAVCNSLGYDGQLVMLSTSLT